MEGMFCNSMAKPNSIFHFSSVGVEDLRGVYMFTLSVETLWTSVDLQSHYFSCVGWGSNVFIR